MALTTRQNTGQSIVGIRWPDDCNSIDPATVVSDQVSDVGNLNREEHKTQNIIMKIAHVKCNGHELPNMCLKHSKTILAMDMAYGLCS